MVKDLGDEVWIDGVTENPAELVTLGADTM